ncbi:hypothetical protein KUTeg_016929 [Tegillarca granosa]|uniref:tRNA-t(6)A37 methylthiotransferase n=1 Tax=Tegillarca granosa TaxID=220873 RepID=A0ABQ9EME1_TEGGR|nr:hypothetical protein KUTeg_016929 [Tegillarca granosa]
MVLPRFTSGFLNNMLAKVIMPSAAIMSDAGVEDIEDIVAKGSSAEDVRHQTRKHIVPRAKKFTKQSTDNIQTDSYVPGTQKIYVKTWGCSHNNSDSEYMAGQLATYGYKIIDLWLLNSCTVKSPAEDHFRNEIKKARELNKHIVVAGCVPQGQPKCLNQCTYCKTKHARGELGSYHPDEIVARAVQSFKEGVVELWLTSEDLGAYGHDIGVSLPQLLWKLVEVIPEGCRMRLGMTNPPYILEHLEEIAKILNHPRVYSFLHVPVQSASDSVLMDMKREYCLADFKKVVDFLRERVPRANIATDIICGFPTETEQDFEETLKLVADYKFASLFINQYFPRPGTPAAKMPKIPAQQLGEVQNVLVTEVSHDKQYYVGHNKSYDQVLVPKDENLMGKLVQVEIVETGKHFLKGRLVSEDSVIKLAVPPPLKKGQVSGATEIINNKDSAFMQGLKYISFSLLVIAIVWRLQTIILSGT